MPLPVIELCCEGLPSALEAAEGGADRVELCEHLAVGGVTPSSGAIAVACRSLAIPVHVLIRPRGGSFVYTEPELDAMRLDILTAKDLGAAGVVLGLLLPDGSIDRDHTAELIALARPLSVTFHKGFDTVPDPLNAFRTLRELGVDRVLTSGQAPTAVDGLPLLSRLLELTETRPTILAGGRITEADLPRLIRAGLPELHLGSAAVRDGQTRADLVRRIVSIVRDLAS